MEKKNVKRLSELYKNLRSFDLLSVLNKKSLARFELEISFPNEPPNSESSCLSLLAWNWNQKNLDAGDVSYFSSS